MSRTSPRLPFPSGHQLYAVTFYLSTGHPENAVRAYVHASSCVEALSAATFLRTFGKEQDG